jgi:hypothetical protein
VPDVDFFNFFRYALGTVVTIYATLVTAQWAVGWYKWLSQPDWQISMMRRYLIISGLRVRVADFWADVLICFLLCVTFLLLCYAHGSVADVAAAIRDANGKLQPLHIRTGG